ncbi:MAG: RNA polymerase sigma-70 factor [Chitinophagaceae bacterium]|nr:RNA polymerase sigma-70 factor [Chitinophagaceae bacterium]
MLRTSKQLLLRPEKELIRDLKNGDRTAFTEVYDLYWEKLVAIGYFFSKDKHAAEDIVHDVMISLWERRNDVEIETLSSYLGTAVKFSVFKMLARQKRRREMIAGIEADSSVRDVEEKLDAKFIEEFTSGVIEQLPEQTRLIFHYSRQQELPVKEIAGKMKISGKAVEYHITKALKALRDSFHKIKSFFV